MMNMEVPVVVSKKVKIIFASAIMVIAGLVATPVIVNNAAAVDCTPGAEGCSGGTSGGNGSQSGCSHSSGLWTCHGATWRWYEATSDNILIAGNSNFYSRSGTVTGCMDEGGYYRYAMVNAGTGAQYGLAPIGGQGDKIFRSVNFGGAMAYRGPSADAGNRDWNEVQQAYVDAKKEKPENFPYNWDGNSALSWFCAPNPDGARYYAKSNVSNGSGYETTGITSTFKRANTSTLTLQVDDTAKITFSHNVYSSKSEDPFDWTMARTMNGASGFSNSAYEIVPTSDGSTSNGGLGGSESGSVTSSKEKKDNLYIGLTNPAAGFNQTYTDGGNWFVMRDTYDVTFKEVGTYEFCEAVNVKGTGLTQVCTKIVVGENITETTDCNRWLGQSGYNSNHTSVISAVNNSMLSGQFSDWQGQINGYGITYAMPTDPIAWQNCYFPGAQKNAFKDVTTINGTWVVPEKPHTGCSNQYGDYKVFHTQPVPSEWTNEYLVRTDSPFGFNLPGFSMKMSNPFKNLIDKTGSNALANGDTTIVSVQNNYGTVADDVGKIYMDQVETTGTPNYTNVNSGVAHQCWNPRCCSTAECGCHCCGKNCSGCCCNTCTVTRCHYINEATRNDGALESKAEVWVPYNFINTTSFSLDRSPVYSGEEVRVLNSQAEIGTRDNAYTERNYATQVDNAQVKLFAYVATNDQTGQDGEQGSLDCGGLTQKQCEEVNSFSGTLNEKGDLNGTVEKMFSGEYNAFDASAGDYMCFALGVYPSKVEKDDEMDPAANHQWYVSRRCSIFAKRPSFQIYGGSFYTAGSVNTSTANKHNVYTAYGYHKFSKSDTTLYGSWVEQSNVTLGLSRLFASGAGYGLANTVAGSGSHEGGSIDFCRNRAPLSLANYGGAQEGFWMNICAGRDTGTTGLAGIQPTTTNRKALVDFWATGDANTGAGYVDLNSNYQTIASPTGVSIRFTNGGDSDMTLSGLMVPAGVTHIIRTNGNVTVGGDIIYNPDTMLTVGQIPKVVIYANNVDIDCNVTQLDAIVVAEGNVNTCVNGGDINSRERSHQLNMRGMIISNTLELGRTYGAAAYTGKVYNNSVTQLPSSIPAEAINYDTSAILWGRYMSGAGESDTMTVTYQHELAPRY